MQPTTPSPFTSGLAGVGGTVMGTVVVVVGGNVVVVDCVVVGRRVVVVRGALLGGFGRVVVAPGGGGFGAVEWVGRVLVVVSSITPIAALTVLAPTVAEITAAPCE